MNDDETRSIYARAGFGQDIAPGVRPAVVVVDLIYGFTDPACSLGSDLTSEVIATKTVLDSARNLNLPIVFTTVAFEHNLKDAGLWPEKASGLAELLIGSREVVIDSRLDPQDEDIFITKKGASAFFGTSLASMLASERVDTVILCGATTSGCIRASAVDLLQHGFRTLVPRECVGDRAEGPHQSNLFDIGAKYANEGSLQDSLDYLRSIAHQGDLSASAP